MSKTQRQQGELESLILNCLWNSEAPMTSGEILECVSPDTSMALTTVLTVLSRLTDKNLVQRAQGEGRSLLFSPTQTRERHTADAMLKLVAGADNPALAFSHFANGLSADQLRVLRESLG